MNCKFNIFIALNVIFIAGCYKIMPATGSASLTIVNVIDSNTYLISDFEPQSQKGTETPLVYFATANQIYYGNSYESGSYAGQFSLGLYQPSDTSSPLWSGTLNFSVGSIHTLFLSGDTTALDTLLTTDIVPYYPYNDDSVAGIRFVNLSRGSGPMSVDIQGNPPTQYEFSNLGYKAISSFKQYNANANAAANGYTFEIRDQVSGNLLATFSWTFTLFKNNTVVIFGSETPNTNTPIQAFQVNNF
jgi:hypothetical protein